MITFLSKHKLHAISTTTAMLLGICGASVVYADAVVEKGKIVATERLYRILDKDMVKVTFENGSAKLSKESIATLADFVKTTQSEAKVDRYLVASWADKAYPKKGELSSGQRKLAALRSEHVKKELVSAGATNVDTFEMTEQPNWIQRAFSTETAEIKDKGRDNTASERLLKEIGQKLSDKGGPRTAVVVAKFRNEILSE